MEEKNTVLMQTNVGLEEELRKANATKGQLETYKRQVPNQQLWWLPHAIIIYMVTGPQLVTLTHLYVYSDDDVLLPLINCPFFAQVVELQNRLSEESKKADKMEFEYKRVKEKVDSLQKEKDVCTVHFISIRTVTL